MSIALRISLILGILVYLVLIMVLLRKKSLNLKYSLLWLFMAAVLLILVLFPNLVSVISHIIGIASPINALFLAFIFFILLLLISLTSIVSKQQRKIKTLIQHLAILQKEIEDIKSK
ncbi:MAG: DUF2304 domain-containing protein [Acutalibacteraceae bacterium]|nr:DUF2304 domain-containing protein [Clostridia bacterium]MEE0808336.1 DUF2304 domain-containing protein [Acutalibacteraceae bacterium]